MWNVNVMKILERVSRSFLFSIQSTSDLLPHQIELFVGNNFHWQEAYHRSLGCDGVGLHLKIVKEIDHATGRGQQIVFNSFLMTREIHSRIAA
jgi:hypothetical protein